MTGGLQVHRYQTDWPTALNLCRSLIKSEPLNIQGCDRYLNPSGVKYVSAWLPLRVLACLKAAAKLRVVFFHPVVARGVDVRLTFVLALITLRPECLVGPEPQDGWAAPNCSGIDSSGLLALLCRSHLPQPIITCSCSSWKQWDERRLF